MAYFISKPTQREREEGLRERTTSEYRGKVRGTVRTVEEAHDLQRQHEREGEAFSLPYAATDGPEVKQAFIDEQVRQGRNPETGESLHSESTKHG